MRGVLIVLLVLFGIPLIAFAYMYMRAAKVVVVSNEGPASVEISEFVTNGSYVERTDKIMLAAGESTWIYFYPKIEGRLMLRCVGGGSLADLSLGTEPARFLFSRVRLDGCGRVISRSGFSL